MIHGSKCCNCLVLLLAFVDEKSGRCNSFDYHDHPEGESN